MLSFKGYTKAELQQAISLALVRQVIIAVVLFLLAYMLVGGQPAYMFAVGLLWSLADTAMVFGSTVRGMDSSPQAGKRLLKITFTIRLGLALLMVFVIVRMKLSLLPVLLAFILMHVFLLLNLLIFTRLTKKKTTAVEKGGKEDGSC
jgi:hypothetical protein